MSREINEDLFKELDSALDEYERQIGMPQYKKMEPPECLSMSLEDIRKKNPDQLSEYGYLMGQYGFYIQRTINRDKAWARWGDSKIDEIAASYLPSVSLQYGFNERVLICRNTPESCKRINAFTRKIKMQLDRMYGIPEQIKFMSDAIRDIKFTALKREKENG